MTARTADATYYTAAEVTGATGVRPEKQYQWDDRGIIVPSRKDKLPSGSGDPRLMSIETVYQLAITANLVSLGVRPKLAANAARKFTDQSQPGRAAGQLFAQDRTVLCIRPTGGVVINAPYFADFAFLSDHGDRVVALDCGQIVKEVDEALSNYK